MIWIFRCCLARTMADTREEADEYHLRNASARQGKIIGRVAGPQAFTGTSATRQSERSHDKTVQPPSKVSDAPLEPPQDGSLPRCAKARVKAAASE